MKSFIALFALVPLALAAAIDTSELEERSASGCYAFEAPNCCVNYAVCQCANGWVYQYNPNSVGGCDPPWGILGHSQHDIPGYCC